VWEGGASPKKNPSCLEELFYKELLLQGSMSVFACHYGWVPIGVIGLVTPSSTRDEESITSYSCFSLGWGLLLATGIGTRWQVQGTSVLRLIRRTRAIEVTQLAQGCKQRWQ
jgi:hypothetical protein